MHNITFISTIHKEIGKCTAHELCKIIEKINPEVIFLEALEDTYSAYQHSTFFQFGVFHNKLEIEAIQLYSRDNLFQYVPVLDNGMSNVFDRKYGKLDQHLELETLMNDFYNLLDKDGFKLLNSAENIGLQDEMRMQEDCLLNDSKLAEEFAIDIDKYENSMIRNIYLYCKSHHFNKAIFMCGAAHRKSIIKKIEKSKSQETININWRIFEQRNSIAL